MCVVNYCNLTEKKHLFSLNNGRKLRCFFIIIYWRREAVSTRVQSTNIKQMTTRLTQKVPIIKLFPSVCRDVRWWLFFLWTLIYFFGISWNKQRLNQYYVNNSTRVYFFGLLMTSATTFVTSKLSVFILFFIRRLSPTRIKSRNITPKDLTCLSCLLTFEKLHHFIHFFVKLLLWSVFDRLSFSQKQGLYRLAKKNKHNSVCMAI